MIDAYTSGQKRHYRREVWAFIERVLRDSARNPTFATVSTVSEQRSGRRVLVLESPQGFEVEHLLRRGYRSSLIHVVNDNAAIVATVQRRYSNDPRVTAPLQTHGASLDTAIDQCRQRGLLFDAMNLDFTGCLSAALAGTIRRASALMKPGGAFVVTVQRGREPWIGTLGPSGLTGPNDKHRLDAFRVIQIAYATSAGDCPADHNGCQWHFGISKWGAYRGHNSHVSMMWIGVQLIPHTAENVGGVWSTVDPFGPRCGMDALQRKNLRPAEDLYMEYRYQNGVGARRFFRGSFADAFQTLRDQGADNITYSEWTRPDILERWAKHR
jgi:hypothetical protein